MFKIGDKVKVIEENLCCETIEQYKLVKEFIGENKDVFVVTYLCESDEFPIEISNQNGEKISFLESELEKVVD